MKPENFRGHTRVNMIEVCEGDGTSMSPGRIVRYFTDDNGALLGKVDPARPELSAIFIRQKTMSDTGKPIPSEVLKNIAEEFDKDIVVMVAWDLKSGQLHGVSYAKKEEHKAGAHNMSKAYVSMAGGDINEAVHFETLSDDHTKESHE